MQLFHDLDFTGEELLGSDVFGGYPSNKKNKHWKTIHMNIILRLFLSLIAEISLIKFIFLYRELVVSKIYSTL